MSTFPAVPFVKLFISRDARMFKTRYFETSDMVRVILLIINCDN